MWQGYWYITDSSWNSESLWSWGGSAVPWHNRGYYPFWVRSQPNGRRISLSPPYIFERKLSRPKLLDQVMKVLERVAESLLWQQVRIDDIPGPQTTDRSQIHCTPVTRKVWCHQQSLYTVGLEKAFDRVPRRGIWWALHKLGFYKCLVRLIQSMNENARSRVPVGCNLSEGFSVKMGVHSVPCLNPVLFIMVLEALSQGFLQDVHEKTWMQMTWSSSRNCWRNCKKSWSSRRLTYKEREERDFRLTLTKPRAWYFDRGSMCFRSLEKMHVLRVSRVLA